jgi:hypothetical protein
MLLLLLLPSIAIAHADIVLFVVPVTKTSILITKTAIIYVVVAAVVV